MGGNCDAFALTISDGLRYYQAGQLKMLAAGSDSRVPEMPDVPSFKECGVSLLVAAMHSGVIAPKGIPEEAKTVLAKAITDTVEGEEFKKDAAVIGMGIAKGGPKEAEDLARNYLESGKKLLGK